MLKIKRIKIKNFRSIIDLDIQTQKMNIFVGLNDAGKSNVLKALNLFFNGETEPGKEYNFETDYSKYAPIRKKKAKEILVAVEFEIPKRYSYHEDVLWTKTWREGGLHKDSSVEWNFTPYSRVPTLLKRVRYKYVPAVKSDNYFKLLLADLYVSIAKEANNELVDKAKEYSEALDAFTQTIGVRVQKIVDVKSNLTMPTNQVDIFKELIFVTSDKSGENIDLSYRGDGIKAVHIPAILKYIAEQDNRLMTHTNVPVTIIWGYEEPENGIEMKKCFELAKELFAFSEDIQEFITTHSPAIYQLGEQDGVKVYYTYKGEDFSSKISTDVDSAVLHDRVGMMPIIAPIIAQKQMELDALKERLAMSKFIDKPTVFVEGVTDKSYLEMAIRECSDRLSRKMDDGTLQIVTREENGCGTGLLVDWAIAWMHMNYKSKAIVLLDADKAGADAKKKIEAEKKNIKSKKYQLKVMQLCPTEDFKIVDKKINNSFDFTIEHLLSYDVWKVFRENQWIKEREKREIIEIFHKVTDLSQSVESIIDENVSNKDLKEYIIYCVPKDEKKQQMIDYVTEEVKKGKGYVMNGFINTIRKLEQEFE